MKKLYKPIKALIFSAGLFAGQLDAQLTYCTSKAIVNADEEIYNVMVNGAVTNPLYSFNNGCSTTAPGAGSQLGLYSNFTSLGPLTQVIIGTTVTYSIAENECDGPTYYWNGIGMWIDYNQNGSFTDPGEQIYLDNSTVSSPRNINGTFTIPLSATLGQTRMRVITAEGYAGSSLNPCLNSYGYGETEDYLIEIIGNTPCSGTPTSNAVVTPTSAICPGSSTGLSLAGNYTTTGITYQWLSSTTSSVGPFTAIPGGTTQAINTGTLGQQVWYQVVITCTNTNQNFTTPGAVVMVQPTTTNTVPYYEGFEGIGTNNELPNCSWRATNLGNTSLTYISSNTNNRTPRNGQKFASFYYNPATSNSFYTNGIYLQPGITYSAALWYQTEYNGYNNWSDLSILAGMSQTTTGQFLIASTQGAAISPIYKSLSNTFTVATAGLYYIAVKATSNGGCCAYYLSWDDLSITIPCSLNPVNVNLTTTSPTVCAGTQIGLTASGAGSYTWSVPGSGSSISHTPFTDMVYTVYGSNALTGCVGTATQAVTVLAVPAVGIFAPSASVCAGSPMNLTAYGALSYTWSTGVTNAVTPISPLTNTTFTVKGSNGNCTSDATQFIAVNQLPIVGASVSPTVICTGQTAMLTGTGAVTYQWLANSAFIQSNPASVSPMVTTTYTLMGTDANGCSNTSIVSLGVESCVGITEVTSLDGLKVYPNPNSGEFSIELNNGSVKTIEISDISGRLISTQSTEAEHLNMDIKNLASGVYYVKVKSENSVGILKVVKQ